MAQNHIQEGKIMPWTNGTGSDVASGDLVVMNGIVGVASGDIANGAEGNVVIAEVFEVPKATPLSIGQGENVYATATSGEVNKTDTDTLAGKAFKAAASDALTVQVLLGA